MGKVQSMRPTSSFVLALFALLLSFSLKAQTLMELGYEEPNAAVLLRQEPERPKAADALQVDCTVARSGRCSMRSKVRITNDYLSFGAHRAEADASKVKTTLYSAGEHYLYRFSLRLAPQWTYDDRGAVDIVWQFKRTSSQPDMFVGVKGQQLVLRLGESTQLIVMDPVPRGQWIDVALDIRWATGPEGRLSVTATPAGGAQGVKKDYAGANMRDARAKAGYVKWGLYKPGHVGKTDAGRESIVWHDDIRVDRLN